MGAKLSVACHRAAREGAKQRCIALHASVSSGRPHHTGGSADARWLVQLRPDTEPVAVHHSALRSAAPRRDEAARCVLGDSAGVQGTVLSCDNGVAVLKVSGATERLVRVLPLDALCRVGPPSSSP